MKELAIESIYIDDVIPYENNPRNNDAAVEYVAESIRQFGFKNPIIIDSNNVIVAGHTRHKAAKLLGIERVPCIRADDLTEDQIKAFRLADNKVAEVATWDFDKLNIELGELSDFDIDMSAFGFLQHEDIDWDNIDDLTEDSYDEPEKDMLECPFCHKRDIIAHFRKVTQ